MFGNELASAHVRFVRGCSGKGFTGPACRLSRGSAPGRPEQGRPAVFVEILRGHVARRTTEGRKRMGGISLGGIIVIVGIVTMIFWSFWIGLIVTLIGLIAFGGFARGKWY